MKEKIKIFDYIIIFWTVWSIATAITGFICWITETGFDIFIQIIVGLALCLFLYGVFECAHFIVFKSISKAEKPNKQNKNNNNETPKNKPKKNKQNS